MDRRRLSLGEITAAALCLPAITAVRDLHDTFASPPSACGTLAAVAAAMLWRHTTAFATPVGAEVSASLQRGRDGRRPHIITDPGRAAAVLARAERPRRR